MNALAAASEAQLSPHLQRYMEAAGRERVGRVGGWECLGGETESEGIADVLPEEDGHEGADAVELDVEIRVEALPSPPPLPQPASDATAAVVVRGRRRRRRRVLQHGASGLRRTCGWLAPPLLKRKQSPPATMRLRASTDRGEGSCARPSSVGNLLCAHTAGKGGCCMCQWATCCALTLEARWVLHNDPNRTFEFFVAERVTCLPRKW